MSEAGTEQINIIVRMCQLMQLLVNPQHMCISTELQKNTVSETLLKNLQTKRLKSSKNKPSVLILVFLFFP